MHHSTCVTRVPWCMLVLLSSLKPNQVCTIPGKACKFKFFCAQASIMFGENWADKSIASLTGSFFSSWLSARQFSPSSQCTHLKWADLNLNVSAMHNCQGPNLWDNYPSGCVGDPASVISDTLGGHGMHHSQWSKHWQHLFQKENHALDHIQLRWWLNPTRLDVLSQEFQQYSQQRKSHPWSRSAANSTTWQCVTSPLTPPMWRNASSNPTFEPGGSRTQLLLASSSWLSRRKWWLLQLQLPPLLGPMLILQIALSQLGQSWRALCWRLPLKSVVSPRATSGNPNDAGGLNNEDKMKAWVGHYVRLLNVEFEWPSNELPEVLPTADPHHPQPHCFLFIFSWPDGVTPNGSFSTIVLIFSWPDGVTPNASFPTIVLLFSWTDSDTPYDSFLTIVFISSWPDGATPNGSLSTIVLIFSWPDSVAPNAVSQ